MLKNNKKKFKNKTLGDNDELANIQSHANFRNVSSNMHEFYLRTVAKNISVSV